MGFVGGGGLGEEWNIGLIYLSSTDVAIFFGPKAIVSPHILHHLCATLTDSPAVSLAGGKENSWRRGGVSYHSMA